MFVYGACCGWCLMMGVHGGSMVMCIIFPAILRDGNGGWGGGVALCRQNGAILSLKFFFHDFPMSTMIPATHCLYVVMFLSLKMKSLNILDGSDYLGK